jgi:hypothetical protein
MPFYRVHGRVAATCVPAEPLTVKAETEHAARETAALRGMEVHRVEHVGDRPPGWPPFDGPVILTVAGFYLVPGCIYLVAMCLFGVLPGVGVGALLSWTGVVDAPVGTATGAGAAIGFGVAVVIASIIWVIEARKEKRSAK